MNFHEILHGGFFLPLLVTCIHDDFMFGLFFDPEDGEYMFLRNVG
jgi:hypothetical protein